ncbi:hypothetical protein BDN67DRAFT_995818 [Paxillus ammoniavirescens]|nr:hypothetical protein BDN67DRAFT_995818 [Paxillus ammoniavirescens]
MSSKRGRKRNDNLPPNRARDVQRAFRARRAAHLQALEMRVSELEEENNCLRAALNLPPANRPALGKGPTGKDKPKSLDNPSLSQSSSKSRDSSPIGESPSPRRSESTSPSVIGGGSIRTPPIMEGNNWDEGFMMSDQQPPAPQISSTPSVPYGMRPVAAATVPQKSPQQFTFSTPMPPRPLATNNVPSHSLQSSYAHTADRPIASGYNDMSYLLCTDVRENSHYSYHYQQPPFSGESTISSQSPQLSVHSQPSHSAQRPHLQQTMPFPQRRSHTEPQAFRSLGSDLHLPSPPSHHISRLASSPPPAMHDVRPHYTSHGKHVNPLP